MSNTKGYFIKRSNYEMEVTNIKEIMVMTGNDFAKKSSETLEKSHDELKKEIFLQIDFLATFEGMNSFDTSDFKFINIDMYLFIKRCDRKMMIDFLRAKLFNVSQWDDGHPYPIISW
jgi:hypothetical protein